MMLMGWSKVASSPAVYVHVTTPRRFSHPASDTDTSNLLGFERHQFLPSCACAMDEDTLDSFQEPSSLK